MEFSRIETLAGVRRTIYNQYDSLVRPLLSWLGAQGVQLVTDCTVTDFEFENDHEPIVVTGIRCVRAGEMKTTSIGHEDLVFFQNGSMTDASSFGSMTDAPEAHTKRQSHGWELWDRIAKERPEFGNPSAFNTSIPESFWESFTITLKDTQFFDQMEIFSGNAAGTGGLVTFKDSNWLMSIVLAHQPHFLRQPADVQVFWGYGLHPDRIGNFVPKSMADCVALHVNLDKMPELRRETFTA